MGGKNSEVDSREMQTSFWKTSQMMRRTCFGERWPSASADGRVWIHGMDPVYTIMPEADYTMGGS
ncbi:hypothetical protein KIN20_001608 [Parelaphostrongylus tenuis]|uniref:Uncharacterized protein n=1 Tax=Parelaphostrongylus tenuis TaxID=148309 RepID=A0AAD5QES2_PARTN|nr:hypothetical protein KIN20_001608 [Parelaphostrongylus tenuis]